MNMKKNGLVATMKTRWFAMYNTGIQGYDKIGCEQFNTAEEMLEFLSNKQVNDVRVFRAGRELREKELELLKEIAAD